MIIFYCLIIGLNQEILLSTIGRIIAMTAYITKSGRWNVEMDGESELIFREGFFRGWGEPRFRVLGYFGIGTSVSLIRERDSGKMSFYHLYGASLTDGGRLLSVADLSSYLDRNAARGRRIVALKVNKKGEVVNQNFLVTSSIQEILD